VAPFILEHHWISRVSPGVARVIKPAVKAIEVAAKINLRMANLPLAKRYLVERWP
jgi:hypothetical protein